MNYLEIAKQNLHDEEKLNSLLEFMAEDDFLTNQEYARLKEEIMEMYKKSFRE